VSSRGPRSLLARSGDRRRPPPQGIRPGRSRCRSSLLRFFHRLFQVARGTAETYACAEAANVETDLRSGARPTQAPVKRSHLQPAKGLRPLISTPSPLAGCRYLWPRFARLDAIRLGTARTRSRLAVRRAEWPRNEYKFSFGAVIAVQRFLGGFSRSFTGDLGCHGPCGTLSIQPWRPCRARSVVPRTGAGGFRPGFAHPNGSAASVGS
jgi:hypothetical protein